MAGQHDQSGNYDSSTLVFFLSRWRDLQKTVSLRATYSIDKTTYAHHPTVSAFEGRLYLSLAISGEDVCHSFHGWSYQFASLRARCQLHVWVVANAFDLSRTRFGRHVQSVILQSEPDGGWHGFAVLSVGCQADALVLLKCIERFFFQSHSHSTPEPR